MLVIELPALSHTKVRCEGCEGPAPADLLALTEPKLITSPVTPLSFARFTKSSLPPDFKIAQAGDED